MRTLLILLLCSCCLPLRPLAQTTLLDTTFGNKGILRTDRDSTKLWEARVLALPDGRLLVAGSYFYYTPNFEIVSEMRLMRFLPDGRPDSSFQGTGVLSFPTTRLNTIVSVHRQSDGKIVLTGRDGRIDRFLADGNPDMSYNDSAQINIGFFGPYDAILGSALQSDDKLLIAGIVSQQYMLTMRFLTNGQLDLSFGFNGMQTTLIDSARNLFGTGIAVQSDGKIVVTGRTTEDSANKMVVIRFLPDGGFDPAFNGTGYRKISFDGFKYASGSQLVIQPDGKLFVAGTAYRQIGQSGAKSYSCFARLTASGALDAGFGTGGHLVLDDTLDITYPYYEYRKVAFQSDGKWLLTVTGKPAFSGRTFALRRFLPSGAPDLQFGNAGLISTNISPRHDMPTDLLVQPDGRIVVAGISELNDDWPQSNYATPALVRYRPDVKLKVNPQQHPLNARCHPNPATSAIQVDFSLSKAETCILQLSDVSGRVMQEWTINGSAGVNGADLSLSPKLSPGLYFLRLQAGASSAAFRLNKL